MKLALHSANFLVRAVALLFALCGSLFAQQLVNPQMLTRGKMWIKANPNGTLERETNMGYEWLLAYPGHWEHRNEAGGGWDANMVYNMAQLQGANVGWNYRNGQFDEADVFAVVPSTLVKNYNLVNPNEPEEYITGVIGSRQMLDGKRHMAYQLEGKVMAWSHPDYDDFIIIKCKLTNTDDVTFENFYYSRLFTPEGPYRPGSVSSGWDVEYLWDAAMSKDIGFIFYDDTSIPPTSPRPVYTIPPGDSTGNAGDPGNIGTQGSVDFKLYSPSLYAFSFIPSSLTPNKNGERKVWRNILSTSSNAPLKELMPRIFDELNDWTTMRNLLQNNAQPEMSWREANARNLDNAGSLWERNPRYLYAIGPYDIAPGQSIEWIEILLCGAMDRNVTIKGGLNATKQFVAKGLENLKGNWTAAQALIANNYRLPLGKIPPPTPADQPRLNNANELKVVQASAVIDGKTVAGVNITWSAVHLGYKDPQTGQADFAGYKIYRSDISVEGPWELLATLTEEEGDKLVDNGKVTYFQKAFTGVPYRYCITSFDDAGNESAKTGFNHFPVAASFQPSNNLAGVRVAPNPFRQQSGFSDLSEAKRLAFINIPSKCTIRIYTMALDLVKTIEHDNAESGQSTWGTSQNNDYLLTDFRFNVMPGVYLYHVESRVQGHEGESAVGKLVIIK